MASTEILPLSTTAPQASRSAVRVWLVVMAALVFGMALVGGATRLTESGLSITQWKPVTGVLPPLNAAEWQAEFDRYRQIPQYAEINPDMALEGFKTIFWWEWSHRLLARIVGAAFIMPALWFLATSRLKGPPGREVLVATGLLALEPIVGWWMVSSGLSVHTEVAQERLAIHLMIAAATFGTLIYAAVGLSQKRQEAPPRGLVLAAAIFAALVYVQLGLGALVAGLRAGLIYDTWPLMGDRFLPSEAFSVPGALVNDPATVQFMHRMIAYAIVVFALAQCFAAWRSGLTALRMRAAAVAAVVLLQASLGIATLLTGVALPLALAHQAVALALFGLAVAHWRAMQGI